MADNHRMAKSKIKRKAISSRTRFEIFKRDHFTCQYCGRKTPEAILELDHVIAVANGGTNDEGNLITACAECNRGKGVTHLDNTERIGLHEAAVCIQERELQIKQYNFWREKRHRREMRELAKVRLLFRNNHCWVDYPVLSFLRLFGLRDVLEAAAIALQRAQPGEWGGWQMAQWKYLMSILRNWKRAEADRAASGNS